MGELSRLRREQIKSSLKPEFYSLCTIANDSNTHSPLLFGPDLAKQIRDAIDANNIGQKISSSGGGAQRHSRHSHHHADNKRPYKGYGSSDYKRSFLGKSQKKPSFKKTAEKK